MVAEITNRIEGTSPVFRPQRLFFAIWPDVAARERLAALSIAVARLARGKPVPGANLHLTLAFLGEVEGTRVELLAGIGGAIGSPGFTLALDRVGAFPRARVAWAGCAAPAAQLLQLQVELAAGLARQGFKLEERPFAPHLTLARKTSAPLAPAAIAPIAWRASELALVRSLAGRYETLSSWRLLP